MNTRTIRLDVRDEIRSGGSPCALIMQAADQLGQGDTLELIAPFEPVPLYDVLGRQGFVHQSREIGGGDWAVWFKRDDPTAAPAPDPAPPAPEAGECGCEEVIELDARGLEPPQPMIKILEAVADLTDRAVIRAHTDRAPLHLLDQLEIRGLRGETRQSTDGSHVTLIRKR